MKNMVADWQKEQYLLEADQGNLTLADKNSG